MSELQTIHSFILLNGICFSQYMDRKATDAKIKSLEKELSDMTRKFATADADRVCSSNFSMLVTSIIPCYSYSDGAFSRTTPSQDSRFLGQTCAHKNASVGHGFADF